MVNFSYLKFDRIEYGKLLPFERLDAVVVNHPRSIKDSKKIAPFKIPLMIITCISTKYDRQNERIVVDIRCKDVKIDIGDDKEAEEAMLKAYKRVKTNDTYVYVQLQNNNNRNWKRWDDEQIDVKYCKKLSLC